ITYPMIANKTIIIDTDAKTVKADGNAALAALRKSSIRKDWLLLSPGVVNTLTYTQVGTGNVTLVIKWQDRA
ncbi:phage distal tail protein, partial [Staphylococcus aureus]